MEFDGFNSFSIVLFGLKIEEKLSAKSHSIGCYTAIGGVRLLHQHPLPVAWKDSSVVTYTCITYTYMFTYTRYASYYYINPFMPTVAINIYCQRDCVTRLNGGTAGAPLKPPRVDSALRALSSLRGLRGHPRYPHYAERRSLSDSTCWNGGNKWVNARRLLQIFGSCLVFYLRIRNCLVYHVPNVFRMYI